MVVCYVFQIEEYSRKQAELESKLNVTTKRVSGYKKSQFYIKQPFFVEWTVENCGKALVTREVIVSKLILLSLFLQLSDLENRLERSQISSLEKSDHLGKMVEYINSNLLIQIYIPLPRWQPTTQGISRPSIQGESPDTRLQRSVKQLASNANVFRAPSRNVKRGRVSHERLRERQSFSQTSVVRPLNEQSQVIILQSVEIGEIRFFRIADYVRDCCRSDH